MATCITTRGASMATADHGIAGSAHIASALHPWEHAVCWGLLVIGAWELLGIPSAAGMSWPTVLQLVREGAVSPAGFLPPVLFLVAALLLVLRSRWALPAFALHISLVAAVLAGRHGIEAIGLAWLVEYGWETLVVWFGVRLRSRGMLA
jgi:hypothetical protein